MLLWNGSAWRQLLCSLLLLLNNSGHKKHLKHSVLLLGEMSRWMCCPPATVHHGESEKDCPGWHWFCPSSSIQPLTPDCPALDPPKSCPSMSQRQSSAHPREDWHRDQSENPSSQWAGARRQANNGPLTRRQQPQEQTGHKAEGLIVAVEVQNNKITLANVNAPNLHKPPCANLLVYRPDTAPVDLTQLPIWYQVELLACSASGLTCKNM